jgi:hypothetical protein
VVIALVATVAVIAGAATAVVLVGRHSAAPGTHKNSTPSVQSHLQSKPTVPEEIMVRYANRDGQLDLQGALELFSYAFAPLSGVTLPAGLPDQPAKWTDVALASILTHYSELTLSQRQVVLPFLNLGSAAGTSSSSPATTTAGQATLTGYRLVDAVQQQFQVKVQQALQDEAGRLGHTLADVVVTNPNVQVQAVLANVELTANKGLAAGAWTWATSGPVTIDPNSATAPGSLTGKPDACYIYFPPSFWKNITWVPGSFEYATLYHEVFHCYQFFVLGQNDLAIPYAAPSWLIEGSATWAGDSMSAYDDPTWATSLQDNTPYGYLNNPRTALDSKAHDAFGLFYEVEYLGRPLWSEWWGIWSSAAAGDWGTTEWFDAVAGDHLTALTNAWGSSYFENAALGHDWAETAPHQTTTFQNVSSLFSGSLVVSADPYSTYQVTIPEQSSGTLVVIETSHGTPRYVDSSGKEGIGDDEVALCWDNCDAAKCPGATSASLPDVTDVTGEVDWALTALDDGGIAGMAAADITQFCKKNSNSSSNQPSPCAWTCAGSNGDPHMTTVDYHGYTFQAAGEYVLLRSPDGSVEIQERQEPWSQLNRSTATDNTAVAARVGSHRVGVYSNGGTQHFVVEVDGAPVTLTAPMTLNGGGRVAPATYNGEPFGIEVDFPDGTTLLALYTEAGENFGINLEIAPSAALRKDAVGILGPVSLGDALPALPNGTALHATTAPAATYKYEYQTFASAWRVTTSDSLFTYAAGTSTTSYNYPGYEPEGGPPPVPTDPAALAASAATCAAIIDVELHDDCVYDVTATGDTGFAAQYAQTDAFVMKGATSPGATTTPPSGALLHALLPNVNNLAGSAVGPDGTLYVLVYQASANASSIIAVDPTTTTIRKQAVVSDNPVPSGLAYSSGSLFLITSKAQQCAVTQVDPTSLSVVATIPLPQCPTLIGGATTASPSGITVAAAANELWVCDGPNLLQVNTANKTLGQGISTLTTIFGSLIASATTVFWMNEVGIYQVDSASNSLNRIDGGVDPGEVVLPAGDGVWEQGGGGTAFFVDNFNSGSSTPINIGGTPIGADEDALYSENPTTQVVQQQPTQGGPAVQLGNSSLPSDGTPLLLGPQNAYRVFTRAPAAGEPLTLYVENFPLP